MGEIGKQVAGYYSHLIIYQVIEIE